MASLTLTPPEGVAVPAGFASSLPLTGGPRHVHGEVPDSRYYRIEAGGAGDAKGRTTIDVGVTPNTVPAP